MAVAVACLYSAGVALGYDELLVLAAGAAVAVVGGVAWVSRPSGLRVTRTLGSDRVERGEKTKATVVVVNDRRLRTLPAVLVDHVGPRPVPVRIPRLAPGAGVEYEFEPPTDRRGVVDLGPLVLTRADPFGLWRTERPIGARARLWVHPKVHPLQMLPGGLVRDLDGSDMLRRARGGLDFETLRDYVLGDDPRLVHWPSSARLGRPVVLETLDTTLPELTVVLDTRARVHDEEGFEHAVEAAASLVVASLEAGFPTRVLTTGERFEPGLGTRTARLDLLDGLATVTPTDGDLEALLSDPSLGRGHDTVVAVTGAALPDDLVGLAGPVEATDGAIAVVSRDAARVVVPSALSAPVIRAATGEAFARQWNDLLWK